jgi:hypothetical protein
MRKRREKFDNRRRVDFTDSQADWLDSQADELKISFMAYVRKLVDDDMERLSLNSDALNTSNSGTNGTRSKVLPAGLFTAEAVAQLLNAMGKR